MILLLELQCKDWEHNRVNSELIFQLKSAFPSEEMKLYAEEKHVKKLADMLESHNIEIDSEVIEWIDYHGNNADKAKEYEKVIRAIIESNTDVKKVIFLSSNKGTLLAVSGLASQYTDIIFCNVLHAALEAVCSEGLKKPLRTRIFELLWSIKHMKKYPQPEKQISMKDCLEKCDSDNIGFWVYTPCYQEELKGKVADSVISRTRFLHLPFYESEEKNLNIDENIIKVGIYGQAVNDNAQAIVERYNEAYDNGMVVFKVMSKNNKEILKQKNVQSIFDKDYVTNEELEEAISNLDFILIPYDRNQYKVTASGIFFDAISRGVPAITLDSPYFHFYDKYDVVMLAESIDAASKMISELHEHKDLYTRYANSERKLVKKALHENITTIKEAL